MRLGSLAQLELETQNRINTNINIRLLQPTQLEWSKNSHGGAK